MIKILILLLSLIGCLNTSIFFINAEEPKESSVEIVEQVEIDNEFVIESNPFEIEPFVDDNGISWQRLEESEALFASLKYLDLGIQPLVSIQGTRVAKYYNPKFGYLTKFNANDGMTYYCIDPYTLFVKGDGYVGSEIDFNKIPFETLLKIAKYISYGYMYQEFTSDEYFIATQLLIWEALGYNVTNITDMNGNPIDVSSQKNEIITMMETVKIQPSFDKSTMSCDFNKECFIEDENHVLSKYYEIDYDATSVNFSNGYPYIENDCLYIKTDKLWELEKQVAVKSTSGGYHESIKGMLLMSKAGSQDLLCGRLSDPILDAIVHVRLNTHNLTLDKYDEYGMKAEPGTQFQIAYDEGFTHLITPSCDMGVISFEDSKEMDYVSSCKIFNEDSQEFEVINGEKVWTVGANGRLSINSILPHNGYSTSLNTKPGHYWIREVNTTNPYQLNTHPYEIDLSQSSKNVDFVNLLRDVDINIFKKDEDEQFRYLNGAQWEVYEVVENPVNYEDNITVGLQNQSNLDYPFDYPEINTQLTYDQLMQCITPIEKDKMFIANDLLWKVLNVNDDSIELGYLTNANINHQLTLDMIPENLNIGDTFTKNNSNYIYLGKVSNGKYVECDGVIYLIQKNSSIKYSDVIGCNLNQECRINNQRVVVTDMNDYHANIDIFESNSYVINDAIGLIDLKEIERLYYEQYPMEVGNPIKANQTIVYQNHKLFINSATYTEDKLDSVEIVYDVVSHHILKNNWIHYDDINWNKKRVYGYTLLDLIEPVYKFVSNEGDSEYHNLEIVVKRDETNDYLLFDEVEKVFPWKYSQIKEGDIITKQYQRLLKKGMTLSDINGLNLLDKSEFVYDNQYYIILNKHIVTIDGKEVISAIEFYPLDKPEVVLRIDEDISIEPTYESIDVNWKCVEVIPPEIIASFDDADWKFFEDFPLHKNRIVHFISDKQNEFDITYIDADCDNDGKIDINHNRKQERTYTHPTMYRDLEFCLQLDTNNEFKVEKIERLHEKESVEVNGRLVYVDDIPVSKEYLNIIYSLDENAPSYEDIINITITDGSLILGEMKYVIIDNIQNENILSIKDENGNVFRYWKDTLHKTSKEEIMETDFNKNRIIIQIENPWNLSYEMLDYQLNQQGFKIENIEINDKLELVINGSLKEVTVVSNNLTKGFESITLEDAFGQIVSINKLNTSNNSLVQKYFIPLNKTFNLNEFFNTETSVTYVISTPYLNKEYQASIVNNNITASRVGVFDVIALKQNQLLHLKYDDFKGLQVNDCKTLYDEIYTVNAINTNFVEVKNSQGILFKLYKESKITLDILNTIYKTVPLEKGSVFIYENASYTIKEINIKASQIENCTIISNANGEEYIINTTMDNTYGKTYQTLASYSFVAMNKDSKTIESLNLKPMMAGVSGNAYLRVIDPSRHNIPISNYPVTIYEDSEGLYPIKTAYSNQWGVVDVSDLKGGEYYWNMPNTVLLQPFNVKKDDGLLYVSGLKYSRKYMACEVGLPKGYEYSNHQDVCIPLTMDATNGYVENISVTDVQVLNKLRNLHAVVYKVDSQNRKMLLDGAIFSIDDIYEEGVDTCSQYDCEGLNMPMLKTRTHLGKYMSGGIYILEQDYVFRNPFTYQQLMNVIAEKEIELKKGTFLNIEGKSYRINDVWFKDSPQQTILLTDGNQEFSSSANEQELIANYEYLPIENVAYEFSLSENFKDSMLAFTNIKGEIKFIPNTKNHEGNKVYQEGKWFYRKVEVNYKKEEIDITHTSIPKHLWIEEKDEFGNIKYYHNRPYITAVYPTQSQYLSKGKIHLNNIKYGHDLLLCETQSPFGYLRDDVCAVFKPEIDYTLTNVNHYRSNKRMIRWEKRRKGYRLIMKRRLSYRQLGLFENESTCAFDWYSKDYMYQRVKERI